MFYTNYVKYCDILGKSAFAVARECGVKSPATVNGWSNGAIPRPKVVDSLIRYFSENGIEIEVSDLFSEDEDDEETQVRDMLRNRPEARMLFHASKGAPASALLEAAALIMKYKEQSNAD